MGLPHAKESAERESTAIENLIREFQYQNVRLEESLSKIQTLNVKLHTDSSPGLGKEEEGKKMMKANCGLIEELAQTLAHYKELNTVLEEETMKLKQVI